MAQPQVLGAVIKLARQFQLFNVPWAIENPEKSLVDDITIAVALTDAQCVQNDVRLLCFWYQMAKTYNCSGQPRGLGWTCGHSTPCAVVGTNGAVLLVRNTCNSLDTTPLTTARRTHRSKIYPMKLASRLAYLLLGPTLTARMQRTC